MNKAPSNDAQCNVVTPSKYNCAVLKCIKALQPVSKVPVGLICQRKAVNRDIYLTMFQSHLYSLGMTLLFAVDYMGHSVDLRSEVSDDLYNLLTQLTQDDPGKRPKLETVLQLCDHALQDYSSQEICQKFACSNTEQCLEGKI